MVRTEARPYTGLSHAQHSTNLLYITWTRTQANAKSVFSGRALRLQVMIETSFGWPLGLPLAWAQVRKLADSRRGRCILCSSSSKISIRPISEVGISPARYGRGWGSGSPRRRRHHVRHCGGGGRSHASAGRPMTVSPYATPPAMLSSDSRSARGSVNLRTGANPKLNAAVRMGRAAVRARMKGRACQGLPRAAGLMLTAGREKR